MWVHAEWRIELFPVKILCCNKGVGNYAFDVKNIFHIVPHRVFHTIAELNNIKTTIFDIQHANFSHTWRLKLQIASDQSDRPYKREKFDYITIKPRNND